MILNQTSWDLIRAELHKEYPKSVLAIREKMKKVLGFTVREHRAWLPNPNFQKEIDQFRIKNPNDYLFVPEPREGITELQIHLDFYSEPKRTMFTLKFSELINRKEPNHG